MTITFLAPDGVELSATRFRQAHAAQYGGGANRPLGGRSGFRVDTASDVFTATSTTWTLKPCSAMIDPGALTHQGMYGWSSDANITGSIDAADATQTRYDRVWIRLNDSTAGDVSGAVSANVEYQAGTAGSGVPIALPNRCFLVADITVPPAGGGSPTVALNPARFASAGAPLPVASSTERDALTAYNGLQVLRKDQNGRVETYNGAAWAYVGQHWDFERGVSTDSNPGDITGTTSLMSGTITNAPAGRYRIDFQTCLYSASLFRGFVRVTAGATSKETRFDWQSASNPLSPTAYMFYTHTGGNLTITGSYRVTAGQPIITGAASGLTHVSAVYLGG